MHLLSGRYVDTLRRENGAWKIAKRTCVRDWSMSLDSEKDWLENSNFVEGRMSGQDPSYEALGLEAPGTAGGILIWADTQVLSETFVVSAAAALMALRKGACFNFIETSFHRAS